MIARGEFQPAFHIARAGQDAFVPGRAAMLYRDLIPSRLGGRFIASHIAIPGEGEVGDWVHFHRIAVQFLVCRTGWARLVYEDQGEPFLFQAGDLVLQPPLIRHQVLESSAGFEVVEIASPALHETVADPEMGLPTGALAPQRDFSGQRFLHSRAADARWAPLAQGWERRDTGLAASSAGLADAVILRASGGGGDLETPARADELCLGFLLGGSASLIARGEHALAAPDAFVIPPGEAWRLTAPSPDVQLLLVTSPAA
jgi:quercetin dioxygenase-like cupin family protein